MDLDEKIIREAAKGSEDAFRAIVDKYKKLVFAICLNVLKDNAEAENAAQETFIKLYHSLKQYEYKGFKTYISRIALNKSIDILRKKQSSKIVEVSFTEEVSQGEIQSNDIEEDFIKREDINKLNNLCNQLPDIYKKIIEMYYMRDMSYKEIAMSEGITIKTVESRLYRARNMLKEKWEVKESYEA